MGHWCLEWTLLEAEGGRGEAEQQEEEEGVLERLAGLGRHGPSLLSTRSQSPAVLSADSQGLVHHL